MSNNNTLHQFQVEDIEGTPFHMDQLKGKKVMIVNTASKCGFTPQFKELENLYQKYKDQNFVIIGFPSNDFLKQDPGSNSEIAAFCQKNYGVTFPMMSKVKVKGKNKHELYDWLTSIKQNGKFNSKVKWNFQKFLINGNGQLEAVHSPKTSPLSPKIIQWIEGK